MIPELGLYCLIVALCLALVQFIVPLLGSYLNKPSWVSLASSVSVGQFVFIASSFILLAYLFLANDFSVAYVAQNSNTHLPMIYRFCAVWGAHEGSLLLWVLILSFWTLLVSCCSKQLPLMVKGRVLAILALISVGFLVFLLFTSNPFARLLPDVPLQGRDLNPLLQDPGLAIHPPMLYMGYVGFAVVFAFAISALLSGQFDANWARWARPWTLMAWSFLTFGITLGSWWAYRVLGWGGWWFWDPVENASFLPWLSGTALVHSLLVVQKRESFKAWTILLAVCTFSLSLIGTFLVRSGILISVHAFATDPARGAYMLYFLLVIIGGSLLLYAWRGHSIHNSGFFHFWSRETLLLTNNVLLATCTITVLLGTLYPLMIEILGLGKLSVGPPYFNSVFIPMMIPLLFLMAIAPAVHWKQSSIQLVVKRFKVTLLVAFLLALTLPLILTGQVILKVILGLFLGFWVMIATVQQSIHEQRLKPLSKNHWRRWGMLFAHVGFAFSAVGIVLSSAYRIENDTLIKPHENIKIGPYNVSLLTTKTQEGPNYRAYVAQFLASRGQHHPFLLEPELRVYHVQKIAQTKTAIKVSPFSDLYIALGNALEEGAWSVRLYYKPFVRFIWLGGILMAIGGMVAAIQSRRVTTYLK